MNTRLLTPAQVAERLQITERTVYGWLRSGRLHGLKMGRRWRIPEENLAAFGQGDGRNDFDEPLTPEEETESEAAWQAYLRGEDRGESLETVRGELVVARRD